jgi:hypothetical protein
MSGRIAEIAAVALLALALGGCEPQMICRDGRLYEATATDGVYRAANEDFRGGIDCATTGGSHD